MLNGMEITGRIRTHVVQVEAPVFAAQPKVVEAFLAMREAAARGGFDLLPVSSFRGFRMQLRIWNRKFVGKAPLYDIEGRPRERAALSPEEIVRAILNWSALPGGSRHQWGSEIDVIDAAAMPAGYSPRLLPEEVAPGGLFRPLHGWLDVNMHRFGFFRPYNYDQGGMYPEPWHLSYAPASVPALASLRLETLREALCDAAMEGKTLTLELLPELFERHVRNIVPPEAQRPVVDLA